VLLGMHWPTGCRNVNGTNHYAVLGVAVSAPLPVIRAAHRAQMRQHHPDAATGSESVAKALNEALRVLQDAKLRAAYDARLGLDIAAVGGTRGNFSEAGAAQENQRIRDARVQSAARAATTEAILRERERGEATARREAVARANALRVARRVARREPARTSGHDVFARGDIGLSSMGWHHREYPPLHIRGPARRGQALGRIGAWLLLAFVGVLACMPAAFAARGSRAPAATVILLLILVPVPALLGGWARARDRGGPWPAVPYVLFLAYACGILVPALAGGPHANALPLAGIGAYALGVEIMRATAAPPRHGGDGTARGGRLAGRRAVERR
jgi:hypothetical protein